MYLRVLQSGQCTQRAHCLIKNVSGAQTGEQWATKREIGTVRGEKGGYWGVTEDKVRRKTLAYNVHLYATKHLVRYKIVNYP